MKRNLHNLNLGFIQLKCNVHFDSTDYDCPKEPPRSEWARNHTRAPIAQDSSKGNQCTRWSIPRTKCVARAHQLSQGNYRRTVVLLGARYGEKYTTPSVNTHLAKWFGEQWPSWVQLNFIYSWTWWFLPARVTMN